METDTFFNGEAWAPAGVKNINRYFTRRADVRVANSGVERNIGIGGLMGYLDGKYIEREKYPLHKE